MPYRDEWATCAKCHRQFLFTVEEQRRLAGQGFAVVLPELCPECEKREVPSGPQEGLVKWYNPEKGYGFIIERGGGEIFFHRSGIAAGNPERFPDRARVSYRVRQVAGRRQAVDVARVRSTTGGQEG